MILQNIIFPKTNVCSIFDLYFRINDDKCYSFNDSRITLNSEEVALFDTYFNGFYIDKWKKYTEITNVSLTLRLKGKFSIRLIHKERLINKKCKTVVLDEIIFGSVTEDEITIEYPDKSSGILTFEIISLEDYSQILGGYYSSEICHSKINHVNLGLCICTYKRERYVIENVNRIVNVLDNGNTPLPKDKMRIYISDNGNTLDSEFDPAYIKLIKNKNTGGAGGFARCMIEAQCDNKTTHVILMDDDILFDVESIYRTYAILSILKREYQDAFIGGAMLSLDEQNIQIESGAKWNGASVHSLKNGLNLTSCEACLFNEIEESVDYNAWWYCAIPLKKIIENGLPIPIFFRGDDIEFGLRNIGNLILLNGICVWHEPFENKYSSSTYYYILRNKLILNSLHNIGYTKKQLIRDYLKQWSSEMTRYRYKNAKLLTKGVEDFLRGYVWLKSEDGEMLHKNIMALGYKLEPVSNLKMEFSYSDLGADLQNKVRPYPWFINLILPTNKNVTVNVYNPPNHKFNRAHKVLNYDYSNKRAFVTSKNIRCALKEMKRTFTVLISVWKEYDIVKSEYRKNKDKITNVDFWMKYLKLE